MNNILNRDQYLEKMNEGFIKDTVKKGVQAVKNFFKIGFLKIKNFIAVLDSKGRMLPVVSPQAVIDNFGTNGPVKTYGSKGISDSIVAAGGNACETQVPEIESDEIYDEGPDGDEYADWLLEKKYKDSIEYKNLKSIPSILKEEYNCTDEEAFDIFNKFLTETWHGQVQNRVRYGNNNSELSEVTEVDVNEFADILRKRIKDRLRYVKEVGELTDDDDINDVEDAYGNLLIFGAPGIGKSTVPNQVIREFNAAASSPAEKMALITVDCPNITMGDFMMPTTPKQKMVYGTIKANPEAFPEETSNYIKNLSPEQKAKFDEVLNNTVQFESSDAPKAWLPTYKDTKDDDVNKILDAYANGGVMEDNKGRTTSTGNGGIIMFDEFLRSDPNVFKQLMVFFTSRQLQSWKLGSKWSIIACTNRPCDDNDVNNVWTEWGGIPAAKDRFTDMYCLKPSPEQWEVWARKKKCDEQLLRFIFDPASKVNGEFPRWHTVVKNGAEDSAQVHPVTPRRWKDAFVAINKEKREHDYKDASQLGIDGIKKALSGVFDKSFAEEVAVWIDDHSVKIDLEDIIKDPVTAPFSEICANDPVHTSKLMANIWEQVERKYKEHPEDATDEEITNIVIWMGIHYKHDMNTVNRQFFQKLSTIFPDKGDLRFGRFIKAMMMLCAAFPEEDLEEECGAMEKLKRDAWPENSLETIKGYMKEYFPWRLDGDKIRFYQELDVNS